MRHQVSGKKLNRTSSHRKALMANLATELFRYKRIKTTEAKAKALRPYAEKLISKAVHALNKEQQGALPEGQTIDIHNRRIVGRLIRNKQVLQELFDSIAPAVMERPGGYTRIVRTGIRRGDAAKVAVIELVDFAEEQDGVISTKKKKKKSPKKEAPAVQETKGVQEEEATAEETAGTEEAQAENTEEVVAAEQDEAKTEDTPEATETGEKESEETAEAAPEEPAAETASDDTAEEKKSEQSNEQNEKPAGDSDEKKDGDDKDKKTE